MENYLNIYGIVKKEEMKLAKVAYFLCIYLIFNFRLRFTFVLICLFVFLSFCFVSLS